LKKKRRLRLRRRKTFGLERDEVTGEWRKLHNEELYVLYYSTHIIWVIRSRTMRWMGHVARLGDRRGAYRGLVGRPKGKRLVGKPRLRWEDNIKRAV
jgi:hypothetical protein